MAYSDIFDNTGDGTLPILTGAGNYVSVDSVTFYAVLFHLSEADATCGPGLYLFTHVMLPLARSSPSVSSTSVLVQVRSLEGVEGKEFNVRLLGVGRGMP